MFFKGITDSFKGESSSQSITKEFIPFYQYLIIKSIFLLLFLGMMNTTIIAMILLLASWISFCQQIWNPSKSWIFVKIIFSHGL